MSDDFLYDQVFSRSSPTKGDKKEANDDVLHSLFAMEAPVKKMDTEAKKKKDDEQECSYINRVNIVTGKGKNQAQIIAKKIKQEMILPTQAKEKRPNESKVDRVMKAVTTTYSSQSSKPKLYMPNIIDPFGKSKEKIEKNTSFQPSVQKVREKPSKIELKEKKIDRKEKQRIQKKIEKKSPGIMVPTVAKQGTTSVQKSQSKEIKNPKPAVPKNQRGSSASSSQSSSSSSPSEEQWRKELKKLTRYDPSDPKFRERDRMQIYESGVNRIFGEDKFSSRMGRLQEEEDLRREQYLKKKMAHKHKYSHSSGHHH